MTPKEKCDEIIKSFTPHVQGWDCYHDIPRDELEILKDAKSCALVAMDILFSSFRKGPDYDYSYWQEVKLEIEKL